MQTTSNAIDKIEADKTNKLEITSNEDKPS